jgi:hypothetical protein
MPGAAKEHAVQAGAAPFNTPFTNVILTFAFVVKFCSFNPLPDHSWIENSRIFGVCDAVWYIRRSTVIFEEVKHV